MLSRQKPLEAKLLSFKLYWLWKDAGEHQKCTIFVYICCLWHFLFLHFFNWPKLFATSFSPPSHNTMPHWTWSLLGARWPNCNCNTMAALLQQIKGLFENMKRKKNLHTSIFLILLFSFVTLFLGSLFLSSTEYCHI